MENAKTLTLGSGGIRRIEIELVPESSQDLICDGCGRKSKLVHETIRRIVRDLPILDAKTVLIVPRRRLYCQACGPCVERLSWLDRYSRDTRRLAESVARLFGTLPIKHVAGFFGLLLDQVKEIDKKSLRQRVETVGLSGIEVIGMDEFVLHKSHRNATVIVGPYRKEVLWAGPRRSRESIRPFFQSLGPER